MNIICAPASFKGSLSASEVAAAMASGIGHILPDAVVDQCPVSDGGSGFIEILLKAGGGEAYIAEVLDPLGRPRMASWALLEGGKTALVELAQASGLSLLSAEERTPMRTSTRGTGQLLALAAASGCTEIILSVGDSATCDGGCGLMQALGCIFLDAEGKVIEEAITGAGLHQIDRILWDVELPRIRIACDVENPLTGAEGAAEVFAPQKGANVEEVGLLAHGLEHLAERTGCDPGLPGSGAAGGAGFLLHHLASATFDKGIDLVLETVGFDDRCRDADLVLTGEGCIDHQTRRGKAIWGVAQRAAALNVPTEAVVGRTGPGADSCLLSHGGVLAGILSLVEEFGEEEALHDTRRVIGDASAVLAGALQGG